ncbi:hypothetical protein GGG87_05125 [Streptococcus sp. zg-86]|uniref:Uncharacterized protein n=1 Tax=Streptococcus zhangguiae TaxID=2664091 RepID=A0A6I4R9Z9_9STRE|nr:MULTISPECIES: DUF6261 family protein [unclassified Streptococcus]MTB64376.1 hypothetical protein [Streptococcus sp. zg-86]MTB90686.1 hypothetical protein [Streptococcus sp. zg-36]MWV56319.1 hypothetical protein [Streptococcus sp. zg-70]QTH47467.1 hypothetical protein J5M87_07885 [Streptococcus sp. zg-86]
MIYTYGIKHLAVRALDNTSFLQLMIESRDAVSAFVSKHKVEAVYPKELEDFSSLLERFRLVQLTKNTGKAVQDLESADRERDAAMLTLSNLIRAFSRVKEPATKAAYETLSAVLKQHKVSVTDSYEKESAKINQLLKALSSDDCQQAIANLYLTVYLNQLMEAQATFDRRYKLRLEEQKEHLPSQSKALRAQLFDIYHFFVDFTAVMASAYPERTELTDLHHQLNIIRQRYKKRKTVKKEEGVRTKLEVL